MKIVKDFSDSSPPKLSLQEIVDRKGTSFIIYLNQEIVYLLDNFPQLSEKECEIIAKRYINLLYGKSV